MGSFAQRTGFRVRRAAPNQRRGVAQGESASSAEAVVAEGGVVGGSNPLICHFGGIVEVLTPPTGGVFS